MGRKDDLNGKFSRIEQDVRRRDDRHSARMAALADISRGFATSLDFATIADRATERIGKALGCISVLVAVDSVTGRFSHVSAWGRDTLRLAALGRALAKQTLSDERALGKADLEPRLIPDFRLISPAVAHFADKAGVGPGIIVPIRGRDEALHILTAMRGKDEEPFDDEDMWFLTEVASHASAALVNAALYHRQTRIAETLQRSLIPDAPKFDCLEVATCYSAAKGEAEIGGDFFDLIRLGSGKVGIVVGDVSGKGIEAAVHTAETKYMLRGFANLDADPEHVVTALNEALCFYTAESTFVTLLYAVVDVANHHLSYVNAGHELPIIMCSDSGTVNELSPGNTVLGVAPGWRFVADSAALYSDDLLFCYTDGITDVPSNGERFGHDRLLDTICKAPSSRPQDLLDHVIGAVQAFGKGKQPDDQVIVVARPTS